MSIGQDANKIAMGRVEFLESPALFVDVRIDRDTVPPGLHMYETRHAENDFTEPVQVMNGVIINFHGTLLTTEPLEIPMDGIDLDGNPFEDFDCNIMTLKEFMEEQGFSKEDIEKTDEVSEKKEISDYAKLTKLGEDMACRYLEDNEIEILDRNWKCNSGEVDIVAEEDGVLVFVEAKTRGQGHPGLPEYAITADKRAKYENIAISYLTENQRPSGRVRFDVIAIQMTGPKQCMLRHHRDAFSSDDRLPEIEKKTRSSKTPDKEPKKAKAAKGQER